MIRPRPCVLFGFVPLAAALAGPAAAHITLAETRAPAGGYYAAFLRVSHGCEGSATTALRVEVPADVLIARPQPKPGWTLRVETAALDKPVRSEGGEVSRRVTAVTWQGRLDPDQFDQFGLMVRLPDREGPLYFPTVQTCERGETRWTDIPAPGAAWASAPRPAPVVTLSATAPEPAAPAAGTAHRH